MLVRIFIWLERYLRRGEIFLCIFWYLGRNILGIISSCVLCHIFKLYLWLEEVLTLCTPNFILFSVSLSVLFEIYLN